jgi:hypothetical protein
LFLKALAAIGLFKSMESVLMCETNQHQFAYTIGADWHASNQSDHISITPIDTVADFVPAPNTNFSQTGDVVLNRSPSFAFSNLEPPSSISSIHVATESGGTESAVSLDNSNHCENVANTLSSRSGSIAQTAHASSMEALSDNLDVTSFTNAADVVSTKHWSCSGT